MNYVRKINIVFLFTITTIFISNFIPFRDFVSNEAFLLLISQAIIAGPSIVFLIVESRRQKRFSDGLEINYYSMGYGTGEDKKSIREQLCFHKVSLSNVIWLILFTICITPAINFVNAISRMFSVAAINDTMLNITQKNTYLFALFCVAFVPCVMEEIVYRGLFYQGYRRVNPLGAAFLSAFLFGILHGNLNQFCYAFVMGIVFAFVIEATDSILSTMIIHFIMNGWSITLVYAIPRLIEYLRNMANDAIARGDQGLADSITKLIGTDQVDFKQVLQESGNAVLSDTNFIDILRTYGLTALLGGVLAFLIYRKIAKNTGRYEYIKSLFSKNKEYRLEGNHSIPGDEYKGEGNHYISSDEYKGEGKVKARALFTLPLLIAIAICVFFLVINELTLQGIISM
ncbi:CPBP family intramembrane glutamic endopeptidase [Lachnoclostridium phytofermentans]|uniref:Abortive infection protein n=1 Tax=Lachnoclostridium phytofermentans (strain ATCC 700394 / DSM 18823 / ISDg) TaxID=357809 RepID=A9KS08_LACP7|nr:CPBP family intramembrane glutamic endopeptidase [Lachnoclostridium phytofermentans]ABX40639.1 Abortive infection protein [Lachnoclostridium phytofermentans ISDg]